MLRREIDQDLLVETPLYQVLIAKRKQIEEKRRRAGIPGNQANRTLHSLQP
jgi:hypothetical protein